MAPRPIFSTANRALRGQLPRLLRQRRKEGVSYRDIVLELKANGVQVSHETVRAWVRQLGIEQEVEQAS
jgi:hypothetical protein